VELARGLVAHAVLLKFNSLTMYTLFSGPNNEPNCYSMKCNAMLADVICRPTVVQSPVSLVMALRRCSDCRRLIAAEPAFILRPSEVQNSGAVFATVSINFTTWHASTATATATVGVAARQNAAITSYISGLRSAAVRRISIGYNNRLNLRTSTQQTRHR